MYKLLVVTSVIFFLTLNSSCGNEAESALNDFKNLAHPFKRQAQCLLIDITLQQISVDPVILQVGQQQASLIYSNFNNLVVLLLASEVLIKDRTSTLFSAPPTPAIIDDEIKSTEIIEILIKLLNEFFQLPRGVAGQYSSSVPISGCMGIGKRIEQDSPKQSCSRPDSYKFYQIQGACLNQNKPGIGLGHRQMTRSGKQFCTLDEEHNICKLPSARSVSLAIGKILDGPPAPPNAFVPNMLILAWFQFIIHETAHTQVAGSTSGKPPTAACGSNKRRVPNFLQNPNMDSIDVACDDPFYKRFKVQCLNFARNRKLNENCKLEKSNFINAMSPMLDLGTIYETLNFTSRKFESLAGPDGKLLKDSNKDFIFGFINNRQHTQLAAINILFGNMHDLIIDELRRLNKSISGNDAFKVAKKILIAFYQHITYTEILQRFLGINNTFSSTASSFDDSINPQIIQEFSAAAGRFSHKFVPDNITLAFCNNFKPNQTLQFRETFHNVNLAQRKLQMVICGAAFQQWRTAGLTSELQNLMFFDQRLQYGTDLFAIDVERARDACLEPFINYLSRLFGACIKSWSDLSPFLSAKAIDEFKKLYENVGDLELYPAGLLENRVGDSLMGSVFTFFTKIQFENIKNGDPKFYTKSLTPEQLNEVVKMSLNDFICIAAKLFFTLSDMRHGFIKDSNDVVKCDCKTLSECFDLSVFMKK